MTERTKLGLAALAGFIGSVVLANFLTARFGFVPVGFGLSATAGTIAIGGAIMTRDLLQDGLGRKTVFAAILVGGALSWVLSNPQLARASAITFLVAEGVESLVYTPLRIRVGFGSPKWGGVVVVANITGAIIDTLLFLWLAGFPITPLVVSGQLVGKGYVTLLVILLVTGGRRVVSRQSVHA